MAKVRMDLRVEDELAAWVDDYAEARGTTRTQVVELAVKELRATAAGGVPELPADAPPPRPVSSRRRRCWRCPKCVYRIFLTPGEPDPPEDDPPVCPDGHGPLVRDQNRPYFGQEVSQ